MENSAINPLPSRVHVQQRIAGASPITFTGLSNAVLYHLYFYLVSTDANEIIFRFNNDGGANYLWATHFHGNDGGALHTESHNIGDTDVPLLNANHAHWGEITFYAFGTAPTVQVNFFYQGFSYEDTDSYYGWSGGGIYGGAALLTRFDFIKAGANFVGWAALKRKLISPGG